MTRAAGLILAVWCALAWTSGVTPAAATDTKPAPAPAPKAAAPKPAAAVSPFATPKPPVAAPKPALAGAAPGLGPKPGVSAPAAHPGASGAGHPALAGNPSAAAPGAAGKSAAVAGPHPAPAGAHGPDVHSAAFRPRELPPDDPARAHGRFDEHVHDANREQEIVRLHEHDFHSRDVRHFHASEWNEWRGGHWHRDVYNGRYGWWYDVDGVWYPYAAPVYPYPVVVAPLIAEAESAPVATLPVAEATDGPLMVIAPLPPPPHVAYHCSSPAGFYPTLATCDTDWVTLAPH